MSKGNLSNQERPAFYEYLLCKLADGKLLYECVAETAAKFNTTVHDQNVVALQEALHFKVVSTSLNFTELKSPDIFSITQVRSTQKSHVKK